MDKNIESAGGRKPRADGERNRLLLMETAKSVFMEKGLNATLDEIARMAGVGIGTLYRHFPNRDALVAAVYRNETEQLAEGARKFAETHEPVEALRAWLLMFVDLMATKAEMSEVFDSVICATSDVYADAGEQIKQAMQQLVDRAAATGDIRLDIEPFDILRALAGIAKVSSGPNWEKGALQLVDIIFDGIRVQR